VYQQNTLCKMWVDFTGVAVATRDHTTYWILTKENADLTIK